MQHFISVHGSDFIAEEMLEVCRKRQSKGGY